MGEIISKLQKVEVDETELENLLFADPEAIEDRVTILGRQVPTDSGPLDLLAMDADNILTVIELKSAADESQLDQGLRYYDWAMTNREWIARSYLSKAINVEESPRLILISPEFPEELKRIAKYVDEDVKLTLLKCSVFKSPSGERYVVCEPIEIGAPLEPSMPPTEERVLGLIEDENVRLVGAKCIEKLKKLGVEVRPHRDWLSMFYNNKRFMTFDAKKHWIRCYVQGSDGTWSPPYRIGTDEDWKKAFETEVKPRYESLGGKLPADYVV